MMFFPVLFLLCAVSLALQDFSIVVPWAYDSFVHIIAVVFFVSAINLPFPLMLALAFFTGFLMDAKNTCPLTDEAVMTAAANLGVSITKSGTSFGFSIFLLGLLGSLMHGIRPLFRKRRWTLPFLMTGVCIFLYMLLEYLWLNLRRGGFSFQQTTFLHIATSTLMSLAVAPFVFFFVNRLARWCNFDQHFDALNRPRW
jgi:hypothetical protein